MEEFDSIDSLKAVLDNINSGYKSLEKKSHWKLHTVGCSLHKNELPLRAVFEYDDGTRSQTAFTGPLGKLCERDYYDLPQVEFMKISGPIDNIGQN